MYHVKHCNIKKWQGNPFWFVYVTKDDETLESAPPVKEFHDRDLQTALSNAIAWTNDQNRLNAGLLPV